MNCEKVRSLLSAYLDRELDYHELRQVELHLADCVSCQEECQTLRATKDLLGMLDSPELPRDFWPELKERMKLSSRPRVYRGLLVRMLVPAAALLALAILPLTFATHTGASKDMTQAKTDPVEPYIREYIISELDRPFSDKTSLGFVATGQAVSMYSSDLLRFDNPSTPGRAITASNRTGRRTQTEAFQRVMFLSPR
jgi:predicted anti-sigma-YlaC factor YlaD